jgi:type I restriction enzyme, R subunit
MDKKQLSETEIRTGYITPAIRRAGWELVSQLREEVPYTNGRIYVRGTMTTRGKMKVLDYLLSYQPNQPLAVVEAKDNRHALGAGMQQALAYAHDLDILFVFTSNGDGFLFHDKTVTDGPIEREITLDEFPSPQELWEKYKRHKGIVTPEVERIVQQDYYSDGSDRLARYYQQIAINRTIEAIAMGQDRVLLVMATGTGKTYTAFQIIYRLWKSGAKKRILFLADRTALIDQTRKGDFKYFKDKMTVIRKKTVTGADGKNELVSNRKRGIDSSDKAYEVFLGLYQGLTNNNAPGGEEVDIRDAYKDFSPDFFDLIVVDECHRGSASEDSNWRQILDYFKTATHIGLTATPRETAHASNSEYFGDAIYTYSLKQGIDDGYLAPYKVVNVTLNVDAHNWRPEKGKRDKAGQVVADRIYGRKDFDRNIVIDERTELVARKITEYLRGFDRMAKTIVFCNDIDHAARMRQALANENADIVRQNHKYVMQITGDNEEGKRELENFTNPEEPFPVIATTSELMTTGVDAQTCKLIVLDSEIKSMTKFKQIIGRGTRINEDYGKLFFTIMDFRNVTELFADPAFDGDPVRVKAVTDADDLSDVVPEEMLDDGTVLDEATGEPIVFDPRGARYEPNDPPRGLFMARDGGGREKIYVNGVDVTILAVREMHFDKDGKAITTSLFDHTRDLIKGRFPTLSAFLQHWNAADRKAALIEELKAQGVLVDDLEAAVHREADLFDIICHVAFAQPPMTRAERARNVKKRNYFTKYGDQARKVLEALLDKYADQGIENIESMEVLQLKPFDEYGSRTEIVNGIFGGRAAYLAAVRELEAELYWVG